MNEAIKKLEELLLRVEGIKEYDTETTIDVKNKLNLYIQKFFNSKAEYLDILKKINSTPGSLNSFSTSIAEFKSLISTLIQDLQIIEIDYNKREEEIDRKRQRMFEEQKRKLLADSEEKQKELEVLKEKMIKERDGLLLESEKFKEFKAKLEIADKNIDFQFQADNNKKKAILWAIAASALIVTLVVILCDSLDGNDKFSAIAELIKGKMTLSKSPLSNSLIENTIYFTYAKFIFTKLLLYSLLLYAITFCVKNYNAQMHNHVINSHKSNAFKSTISLLNTAKSEDGNDKLLVQATQAIFSHQQTGYSGKGTEPSNPNLVTNVIDAASKKI